MSDGVHGGRLMDMETKDHLLGVFLAVLDGRDPRHHVMVLDGDQCLAGHEVFRACDSLMKAQFFGTLTGAPPDLEEGAA